MKKLSLLVALVLCITIGGVYSTWFYAESTMSTAKHSFKNVGITDVDTSAQSGRIAVTDTMILKIDDNAGNHKPGWDADVNASNGGMLQIVFTPNSGAGDTTLKYTISVAKNTYGDSNPAPIFKIGDGSSFTAHDDAEDVLTGTFDFTAGTTQAIKEITLADIQNVLKVNDDIVLTTIEDYNAYSTALSKVELVLTVEEVTNP
ncbi:MAG: hypothetical protein IJN80_04195 [Clostridia bacterium]|nr:hypothetical protein [Clostridia bacterium]